MHKVRGNLINRCWTYETAVLLGKEIKVGLLWVKRRWIICRMNFLSQTIWSILDLIIRFRSQQGMFSNYIIIMMMIL